MALENKYPTKLNNQLVPPPENVWRELPVPAAGIFDTPTFCFPSINPAWVPFLVGRLHDLADEQRWEGDDADKWFARQQIDEFLSAESACVECPECPDPPAIWSKTFDFRDNNGGFSTVSGWGTWVSGTGWSVSAILGGMYLHITRNIASSTILGMSMKFDCIGGTQRTVLAAASNPGLNYLYYNQGQPSGATQEASGAMRVTGVTTVTAYMTINAQFAVTGYLRRLTAWGEGTTPF